ncbi:MAG TPA: tetratricopeptide repeat protein, partial [Rectinemataceae bacterium]|nr:tetratricopeptide repeat protein [Rectinemataceae bacterium]
MPMHRSPIILLVLLVAASVAGAQQTPAPRPTASPPAAQPTAPQAEDSKATLARGIDLFGQGRFREALDLFGRILADPRAAADRPEAAYWSALAYISSGDSVNASSSIDAFLSAYPPSGRVPDLLYQKGRLLYLKQDYEGALRSFAAFADVAPSSDLMPSALYWSGECLYALGRLEEAERAFAAVVEKYPSSVKVEAASYRRSLIGLEYRERELIRLLTWSHEESLRAADDFRRRERAYEQSVSIYQKQIADLKRGAPSDQEKTIADLRSQVADLGSKLASSDAQLSSTKAELDALRAAQAAEAAAKAQGGAAP